MVEWRAEVLELIDLIAAEKDGWDGRDAKAMRPEIVEASKALVNRLSDDCEIWYAAPMTNGTIQLEAVCRHRSVELEFTSPDTLEVLKWSSSEGFEDQFTVAISDQEQIESLIRWVHTCKAA